MMRFRLTSGSEDGLGVNHDGELVEELSCGLVSLLGLGMLVPIED
jgi:hypothetical protein